MAQHVFLSLWAFVNIDSSLHGLVLAGGRSSRMGQSKAHLIWNGLPLYQHMAALLDQAGVHHIFTSGNFGVHSVPDLIPDRGPLSGIHAALHQLEDGERLLVVPVDMPLLPSDALILLTEQYQPCCFDGYTLPVLLPVNPLVREWVELSIYSEQRRDYSLWRLHQHLQGITLSLPEGMAAGFSNANTPEDWQRCQVQKPY